MANADEPADATPSPAQAGVQDEDQARNARADEKSRKRKAARDKILATKTIEKGLLIVHTGKGKGKSTAAFGLVTRAIGNDMRVGIVQYVKGKWETGERKVLEHFPDQVEIRTMGEGFTWETQDRARDIAAAKAAWEASKQMIEACRGANPRYDLILLDELNIVLRYDYLPLQEVVDFLANRPADLHVVVTGRNAKQPLIEAADLVTDMTMVKHPFRAGVKAQKGIEF
ncbi:MAG: cob(I)yrinic acid a,c-diamide adenosyltransferase [Gammaproteobacteria bacterium]|nr:cob(I)yrinic acid a,c-diamide adenosyltransferase [Gammaproteobacteria bacterium]